MDGIFNIYKEKGFTSHDVVAIVRRTIHMKKVGHTGTLDPDAEGVLPVCVGKATKLSDVIMDGRKSYRAMLRLGVTTTTEDASGEVLETKAVVFDEGKIRAAVAAFIGRLEQVPPMYSAVKVNGKKLYELAREGKTVERKARPVEIKGIQILEVDLPRVRMEVECSKGTYIRTLCHDIGEKLGCGGCMESLVRTRVERFLIKDSLRLEEIERLKKEDQILEAVIPVDQMFTSYKAAVVKNRWMALAKNGNVLPYQAVTVNGEPLADQEKIRLYDEEGQFIALYKWEEKRREYQIKKMFFNS